MNSGVLSFGNGLKVGSLIVLFPAIFFGLFDVLYAEVINPDWVNDCYEGMKREMSPEAFAIKKKEFEKQLEMFSNPFFQFLIMSVTVFIIGFIVTIISTLALRTKTPANR